MSKSSSSDSGSSLQPPVPSLAISRRAAIAWVAGAAAALHLPRVVADELAAAVAAKGYGKDPNLLEVHKPGGLWPLTFNKAQQHTASALSDVILPQDGEWPAASALGVVAFVDEWISAPYAQMAEDRPLILDGLAWLEAEAQRRYQSAFPALTPIQTTTICDAISGSNVDKAFERASAFFARFRMLVSAAYYTTPQGMRDLGYVGNVPLAKWEGPGEEVLERIGL